MRRGRLTWVVAGMGAGLLGLVGGAWGQTSVQDQYGQPTQTATVTVSGTVTAPTVTQAAAGVAPAGASNPGGARVPGTRAEGGEGVRPESRGPGGGATTPGAGPTESRETGGGSPNRGSAAGKLPFTGLSLALLALIGAALLAGGLLVRASQRAAAKRAA